MREVYPSCRAFYSTHLLLLFLSSLSFFLHSSPHNFSSFVSSLSRASRVFFSSLPSFSLLRVLSSFLSTR
ncbi:hypothetical protein CSUI_001372 [Cystoisospora suis]|uniref:Transmembrane protein n=1 Tax=Cystoisospora suis TaxID=483139 RepID=A0A2C6LAQ1_9APIC|nr:hypothetical protein CSUI_001372 [Cystoisospora suis]